jgi:hypothetical protein
MKKLLLGAAFVAMLATPALAQSFDPDFGSGNINPPYHSIYGGQSYDSQGLTGQGRHWGGRGAYAYEPRGSEQGWSWGAPGYDRYIQRQDSDYPVYR